MDLLNFQGATSASSVAMLGVSLSSIQVKPYTHPHIQAFYGCAGIGLYLACIMEWVLGNTFPCVVFGTFGEFNSFRSEQTTQFTNHIQLTHPRLVTIFTGGFWISYGIAVQPTFALAASFAPASDASNGITAAVAGAATREYNAGLGLYFMTWGIMCVIYFIAALRT